MRILRFLALCLVALPGLHAQTAHGPQSENHLPEILIQNQSVLDSLVRWEERLYLHTDRRIAMPGEAIFFKSYAMTGPKRFRVSPSGVLKVDLLDSEGTLVSSQYYRLRNGMAEGAVRIPEKLQPDTYTIRAYTRWMQNYGKQQFFTRQIRVVEEPGTFEPEPRMSMAASVEFYPEGGKLLAGLNNKLIIRAVDALGCPVTMDGEIRTATGKRVVDVESYDLGLGMSMLQPEAGIQYVLHLAKGGSFPLPEVHETGYSLQVNPLDPENLRITIAAVGQEDDRLRLEGTIGGKTYLSKELDFEGRDRLQLEIPKKQLPVGHVQFSLSDPEGSVLVERPVWLEGPEALQVSVEPIAQDLREGGSNRFKVQVLDAQGKPVQTEISFSVTADTGMDTPGLSDYLRANPGMAEPGRYRKTVFLEDLNALGTQPHHASNSYPDKIVYPIQQNLELIGYAYDLNNELLRNTEIQVMSSTDENLFIAEVTTDPSGILKVSGIEFAGEIPLIFRTKGEDTPSKLVRFEPLHDEIFERKDPLVETQVKVPEKKGRKAKEVVETTPWAVIDTTGLIALAEATVTAKKKEVQATPSVYGIEPRRVIRQDPKKPANSIVELLQRMPGVFVSGNIYDNPSIRVPSGSPGPIRWVVDGLLLVANRNPFALIPIIDIERIELLSTADASIYGSRGTGAILAIYTRNGSGGEYVRRKDAMVTFKGFESEFTFEDYLELRQKDRKLRKEAPATLYWNPAVQTNENGEAIVEFQSPSDYEQISITAETLTPDGRPGAVQRDLSASEKTTNQ